MWRALLIFAFPALELYLLVKVGAVIGALNTVLWVFASAFLGIWVARAHSQYSIRKVMAEIEAGRAPQNAVVDGMLVFFAGVLLILPGLITDAAGLLLLLPFVRALIARSLSRRSASGRVQGATIFFSSFGSGGSTGPGFGGNGHSGPSERPSVHQDDGQTDLGPRQATIIESTAIDITAHTEGGGKKD
jgi:UPF0716 protein FxsA